MHRWMKFGTGLVLAGGLVLLGAGVGVALGGEKPIGGQQGRTIDAFGGTPRYVESVVNDGEFATASLTFVDVSGMAITHSTPQTGSESLLITVSGFVKCHDTGTDAPSGWCLVRVMVDDTQAVPLGNTILAASADANDVNAWNAHTVQFIGSVSEQGPHTVTLQARVDEADTIFNIDNIAMSVVTFAEGAAVGQDGLMNEGKACFLPGQSVKKVDLSGPGRYDVTAGSLGFATLQRNAGTGISIRNVVLNADNDTITIVLTSPATRIACAAWSIVERG